MKGDGIMTSPELEKLKSEVRVGGVFMMAAGYATVGELLPDDLVRVIRFLMRYYPDGYEEEEEEG